MRTLIASDTKKDFDIHTFCSGGPGGQHQNKTETGVRIVHKKTGLSAESREHRSQQQNKKSAFRKLAMQLKEHYRQTLLQEFKGQGRVYDKIRTYHAVSGVVTDHRTGQKYDFTEVVERAKCEDMIHETMRLLQQETGND